QAPCALAASGAALQAPAPSSSYSEKYWAHPAALPQGKRDQNSRTPSRCTPPAAPPGRGTALDDCECTGLLAAPFAPYKRVRPAARIPQAPRRYGSDADRGPPSAASRRCCQCTAPTQIRCVSE